MDTYSLTNFLYICEYGSINKAAKAIHISQPSLTHQVQMLETELKVKLFERSSSGVSITKEGMLLKARAEQILALTDLLNKELANLSSNTHCACFGATTSSIGFATDMILSYDKADDLSVDIKELNTYELINLLRDDKIDFAFLRTPFVISDAFVFKKLTNDHLTCVGKAELLPEEGDDISLETLSTLPLIINRRWQDYIKVSSDTDDMTLSYKYLCDDNRTAYTMAQKGLGIAILPFSEVKDTYETDGLALRKLENDRFTTGIFLTYRKSREFPSYIRDFLNYVERFAIN
jgi:DNA-binding transcriptional LysR family regulator